MLILLKIVAFLCVLLSIYSFVIAEKWYQKVISLILIIVSIMMFVAIL